MIFKITKDKLIENSYKEGMKELIDFWQFNWSMNTPDVLIVESRKDINEIWGEGTSSQIIGWANHNQIYLLDYNKLETESSLKLSRNGYKAFIKHELCHLFFKKVSKGASAPKWLKEGLSIYLSGQTKLSQWKKPIKFQSFIQSNDENKKAAYEEGGFFIEFLVKKYGKRKILDLIKSLPKMKSKTSFEEEFKKLYGYELTYKNINKEYLS
ncbi:MAG: hypothetical protein ABIH88_01280 [Patescibacteria group bacterium]|nr:hypothetical protein [Patescibacteria group bacterium]